MKRAGDDLGGRTTKLSICWRRHAEEELQLQINQTEDLLPINAYIILSS
jgi:hypothetical protein